jgi:hypothetical protein
MRIFLRAVFAATTAALLAATMTMPADAAVRHPHHYLRTTVNSFDGVWSVAIYTSYGSCNSYRAALRIAGGRVQSDSQDFSAAGAVNRKGVISVTVTGGGGTAVGYGRLVASRGAGRWRTESGQCAGTWYATKR